MATVLAKRRREFGERLRTERERLGYTELQIAQLLGVPLEMYQKYELGQEDPGIFRMPRLNDCGFDILFIITSDNEENIETTVVESGHPENSRIFLPQLILLVHFQGYAKQLGNLQFGIAQTFPFGS